MTDFDRKMANLGYKIKAIPTNKVDEPLYFREQSEIAPVIKGLGLQWCYEALSSNTITSSFEEHPLVWL